MLTAGLGISDLSFQDCTLTNSKKSFAFASSPPFLSTLLHCNPSSQERLTVISLVVVKDTGKLDSSLLRLIKELNL